MKDKSGHSHRELEVLDALRRFGGTARNTELASILDVSEETVRRTIKALSKTGAVARVHGGAYLVGTQSAPSFFRRISHRSEEKALIAREVAGAVEDGMTIFLDVGSTTAFAAEELRVKNHLTVATNSIGIAQTLVGHNSNRVFLLGGEMQSDEHGAFGHVTQTQARRYAYDLAVLSADALNARHGFLYTNAAEADLASVVVACSERTLIAMVHDKFGKNAPHRSFAADRVDRLFVDKAPDKVLRRQLETWGVKVEVAGQEAEALEV